MVFAMNNEPVAWMSSVGGEFVYVGYEPAEGYLAIPLYTHPVKELHLSLQKSKETGELLAVTYTDDEPVSYTHLTLPTNREV